MVLGKGMWGLVFGGGVLERFLRWGAWMAYFGGFVLREGFGLQDIRIHFLQKLVEVSGSTIVSIKRTIISHLLLLSFIFYPLILSL